MLSIYRKSRKRTSIFTAVMLLIILTQPFISHAQETSLPGISTNEVVEFADENLESAIRAELGIAKGTNITYVDISRLESLEAGSSEIKNLSGLESAINLKKINLQHNNIKNIGVLGSLTNLQVLILRGNNIRDITPLKNLTNLVELDLRDNNLDISEGSKTMSIIYNLISNGCHVDYTFQNQYKEGWILDNDKWYFIKANGEKATGWLKDDGKWYYLNSEGVMQTGWQKIGGKWYYLKSSGAMATGWVLSGGKWYYLSTSGAQID